MKYHELVATTNKDRKRVGRGISAGGGKTAGRGTKGQKARTGKKLGAIFMGGQRALMQATPKKKGFKSLRAPAQVVYVDELAVLKGKTADNTTLFEAGLINTPYQTVKVIGRGELTDKVTLRVQACSASAREMITKAGGTFESVVVPVVTSTDPKKVDIRERKVAKAEAKAAKKTK